MSEKVAVLMNRASLGMSLQSAAGPSRALARHRQGKFRRLQPRLAGSSRNIRQAAALSPPMFLTANRTFWPFCLTPRATSKENEVDFLSPSRIKRMIGSPARDRLFQTSQSPFTLRQTRLTVSLPRRRRTRPRAPGGPAAFGPGKIGAGDQRVSLFGARW
jgi:hypothetical protein